MDSCGRSTGSWPTAGACPRSRGWLSKAFTYWFDEPDRKDFAFVVEGMKRLKAAAPGIRRMLTKEPNPELLGHVDIWCGLTPQWTPEKVRQRRAAGEEVWWYICTGPKAPYVTEFIDHSDTELCSGPGNRGNTACRSF